MGNYQQKRIQELVATPLIAWPTVTIFCLCLCLIAMISHLAITEELPLSFATILNGVTIYFLFSAVHDSAHFAISRVSWLNNIFGHVGMLFLVLLPHLTLRVGYTINIIVILMSHSLIQISTLIKSIFLLQSGGAFLTIIIRSFFLSRLVP